MKKRHDSEPFKLIFEYGEESLSRIVEDLAKQTVQKQIGQFLGSRKSSARQKQQSERSAGPAAVHSSS